jgi:hypothetical protein
MAEQNQAVMRKVCPAEDSGRVRRSAPQARGTLLLTLGADWLLAARSKPLRHRPGGTIPGDFPTNRRYHAPSRKMQITIYRRSVIVTTNRAFKEWNEVFPNASCIVTLVDRLTHHADVTKLEGESYRLRESELEAAARRKKK